MANISWVTLILIVVLVGHIIEEIKTDFRRKFPLGEMPRRLFVSINVVLYLFCLVAFSFAAFRTQLAVPLAWIFAIAMLLNGVGHVAIMVLRRGYFPGGLTALLLVPISVYLMIILISTM